MYSSVMSIKIEEYLDNCPSPRKEILSTATKQLHLLRPPSSPLEVGERSCHLQWSNGRRFCSEPGALVDSGRGSLTSFGSQESLLCSEESDVFSDHYNSDDDDDEDHDCFDMSFTKYQQRWQEWTISSSDIQLNETINTSSRETVRSGYWHGTVWIHQRSSQKQEDIQSFAREINTLCRIRHENIQLFMGVCLDLPDDKLGIVMSEVKGDTLYSHLHRLRHNFTAPSKLKILRQISEGMEYLHAKGIQHGSLSSKLVTIHHRVCISLSFQSASHRKLDGFDLIYLPPEEVRAISQHSQSQFYLPVKPSNSSDVFAFGTLTYELVTIATPFKNQSLVDLVWNVGNGRCQPLTLVPKSRLKSVISRCWNLQKRPTFKDILTSVQDSIIIPQRFHSSYSTSVPTELCSMGK